MKFIPLNQRCIFLWILGNVASDQSFTVKRCRACFEPSKVNAIEIQVERLICAFDVVIGKNTRAENVDFVAKSNINFNQIIVGKSESQNFEFPIFQNFVIQICRQ